jgi:hypothetical protein
MRRVHAAHSLGAGPPDSCLIGPLRLSPEINLQKVGGQPSDALLFSCTSRALSIQPWGVSSAGWSGFGTGVLCGASTSGPQGAIAECNTPVPKARCALKLQRLGIGASECAKKGAPESAFLIELELYTTNSDSGSTCKARPL